jgi:hypothetical protein
MFPFAAREGPVFALRASDFAQRATTGQDARQARALFFRHPSTICRSYGAGGIARITLFLVPSNPGGRIEKRVDPLRGNTLTNIYYAADNLVIP